MTKRFDRVFLIGVDGAGIFFRDADTPNIDRIMNDGACTYEADTAIPTSSAPCWGSMLIGVDPDTHKLTNSYVEVHEYPTDCVNPSIFRRIREAYPTAELASFSNWDPINRGIIEHNLGVTFDTDGDRELTEKIVNYLDGADPKFMFVQYDSVDGAGHDYGYGSKGHLDCINEVDGFIGQLYDKLSERGLLENSLFIVTADHGGTPTCSHGGVTEAELKIYFGAAGDGVKKNGAIGEMFVWDIPAVVLHAFGIDVPEYNENGFIGIVPDGLFENYTAKERKYTLKCSTVESKPIPKDAVERLKDVGDLTAALFFEGDVLDAAENVVTEAVGRIKYYGTGVYSRCAELGKRGHVKLPSVKVGTESFTVSLYIHRDSPDLCGMGPALFGTKERRCEECDGFVYLYTGDLVVVKIWNGDYYVELPLKLTTDELGWINLTVVFDRETESLTHYCNFERIGTIKIPTEAAGFSFDGDVFTVGNDARGTENDYINLMFDDFLIYKGALTDDDVKALGEYYKK